MSEGFQTDMETLGTDQMGTQREVSPGARLDTESAVPTDFTARGEETGRMGGFMGRGGEIVGKEPWRALGIALFLGFLLGRRTRPKVDMVRDDYLEPAIDRAQGAMIAGTLAMGAMLRMLRRTMAWRTREAMFIARFYAKPLTKATRKATRRAQRKLHIGKTPFLWR